MIAVRLTRDQRAAIVGSPEYFKEHTAPKQPRDLLDHNCVNFRHGPEELYRWEFEKGKKQVSVAVNGSLVVDDTELVYQGALQGVGLAFLAEHEVASYLQQGRLVRVLEDWCQPFRGFFLYYPSRRQQTAALTALVSILRSQG